MADTFTGSPDGDRLEAFLWGWYDRTAGPAEEWVLRDLVDALMESDWLAGVKAEARRQALDDAHVAVVREFNARAEMYGRDERITPAATVGRDYAHIHFGKALQAIDALRTSANAHPETEPK